ncbi:MAG TPA: hypothetical protein VF198_07690 [Vicinamibacterales bacterium]
MASDRTRRFVLLGALGAAALVAVRLIVSEPGSSTQAPDRAPRGAETNRPDATALERVQLDALSASRPDPAEARRNPFRFGSTPRAVGAPASTSLLPAPGPGPANTFAPPPVPAGPPPPPPIPLKFIGIVERGPGLRLAVLSDGRNVFYGREGEILEGRYRIERIGPESIDLAWADGRGRQTIRLSGS